MDINSYIEDDINMLKSIDIKAITRIADLIIKTIENNGKIISFGNGGSSADADHLTAELNGHFLRSRSALPALSLSNGSVITAISNDYGYENVFSRQIEALCNENDCVIGITTSGRSINVINALKKARDKNAITIAMTGSNHELLKNICNEVIYVNSDKTPNIQDIHTAIIHIISYIIDEHFY
ncbi:D-sedoheptulose-7-phosphate isomerase [Picrophilus oshimae]|uniref:Phosphoheptose isomerase n=1 Tax=Picrophilus torridus (strain ATCC 700027 / DSM 9790 / JCM 10055 / NBRC 100828 / KAW 2/3) TaxID=1122961 RepID=Q6L191_PICTO|nr:SIS domain-containing protein [Picrophilus oshimae]AAT43261.1 phosphoheptose isomerase [Picrophilus oshimae DSM 9789]